MQSVRCRGACIEASQQRRDLCIVQGSIQLFDPYDLINRTVKMNGNIGETFDLLSIAKEIPFLYLFAVDLCLPVLLFDL